MMNTECFNTSNYFSSRAWDREFQKKSNSGCPTECWVLVNATRANTHRDRKLQYLVLMCILGVLYGPGQRSFSGWCVYYHYQRQAGPHFSSQKEVK